MPSSPSGQVRPFRLAQLIARPFAHRGLHGDGRIENSRAAFLAAIAAGSGIELDVQASADGEAMVFHDADLARLVDARGALAAWSAAHLRKFRLSGSDETIPTLAEILGLIAGRAPLLIEVKSPNRSVTALCRSVAAALAGYEGAVGVMSFNPEAGAWFARHDSERLRGLVVTEQQKGLRGYLERPLAVWRSRADFLAYDIRDLPSRFADARRANGMPVLTWTVRTLADRARAAEHASQIIYEMPRACSHGWKPV
jgi:glycerophosphoryl diester phosphodiesterase